MRNFCKILVLLGFTSGILFSFALAENDIRTLIPLGNVKVDVMEIGGSPRMIDLMKKLQAAVSEDPAWWREYVAKAEPGKELPYSAKMGITEAEYEELKELSKKLTLNKIAETTFEISTDDQKTFVINGGSALPELTGIEIDLIHNKAKTPFGILDDRSEIQPDERQTVTGRWGGIQWKLEKEGVATGTGTIVKLALGKRLDDGRGIMYYDVKSLEKGKTPIRISRILLYHLTR